MGVPTNLDVVRLLREHHLLDAAQLQEAERLAEPAVSMPDFSRELIQRGWLTPFQAEQIAHGRGNDLVLDQYVLLDLLGEGGMGAVYKARQQRMKRLVAVKLIRRQALAMPGALERFQREAEATAQLSHPNIVMVFDTNQVNGTHFLVMEYLEGSDLARLVKQRGPFPVGFACDCIRQAALGLQHAHEQGLIHRDVKPHNLMLTKQSVVKVMDLGLARTHASVGAVSEGLTATGAIMGTPDYLAPEQAMNAKGVDIRADVYSLGCTLYHLLAGRPPFVGENLAEKLVKHQLFEPEAIEQVRTDLPPGLPGIVRKMMAKKPEDRYQTPGEVAQALAAFGPRPGDGALAPASAPVPAVAGSTVGTISFPGGASQDTHPGSFPQPLPCAPPPIGRPGLPVTVKKPEERPQPAAPALTPSAVEQTPITKSGGSFATVSLPEDGRGSTQPAPAPKLLNSSPVKVKREGRSVVLLGGFGLLVVLGGSPLPFVFPPNGKQVANAPPTFAPNRPPNLTPEYREPNKEVIDAWKKAGAKYGACEFDEFDNLRFTEKNSVPKRELPGFLISSLGPTTNLLDAKVPFGLIVWNIDDAGLKELARLPSLQSLNLHNTQVGDAGLTELAGLQALQTLDLGNTRVSDAGLTELTRLPALHTLNLAYTKVSDAGLKELAKLNSLQTLRLASTKVSDVGLRELSRLPSLQALDVAFTKVSDQGVAELKKALPNCTVSH